nr:stress-response A/B barrel domain-containing protein UP3-like [Ipomoea batatas]
MVNNISGLASLPQVRHLNAGLVLRTKPPSLAFTHLLHAQPSLPNEASNHRCLSHCISSSSAFAISSPRLRGLSASRSYQRRRSHFPIPTASTISFSSCFQLLICDSSRGGR